MKKASSIVIAAVLGFIVGIGASAIASQKDLTNVRMGPTAAISVATSADGQIVYVVNGSGFFKSDDGGATFTKLHKQEMAIGILKATFVLRPFSGTPRLVVVNRLTQIY